MNPAAFDYLRPADLDEALDTLHEAGSDAKVMAGGQSLMPMLNMRLLTPSVIVDISDLEALDRIERSPRGEYELTDAVHAIVNSGEPVAWYAIEGFWRDVGRPEDLAPASDFVKKD